MKPAKIYAAIIHPGAPRRWSRARLSSHKGRGGLKQIVEVACPPRY